MTSPRRLQTENHRLPGQPVDTSGLAVQTLAFELVVSGRVQGVGYRASLAEAAQALGLAGWVRNLHDGRVQAQCYGSAAACDALIRWARRGPPSARVTAVDAMPIDLPSSNAGKTSRPHFEIRRTV
ncbi:MAG: acylphosphatase [Burkholderiales bacterium]|nr:acylphosphatase [Burkholderiales bacterium]